MEEVKRSRVTKNKKILNKDILIMIFISLILGFLTEILFSLLLKKFSSFSISRGIKISLVILFIVLQFKIGLKSFYSFIIKNRYIVSFFLLVLLSLLEIPNRNIFDIGSVFGIFWYIEFFSLFLVTYEFFGVITNKNMPISFCATLLFMFSAFTQNLLSLFLLPIFYGELAIIVLNKYLKNDNNKDKLYLLILVVIGILYSITIDSFLISYGYVFLALAIWQILENVKDIDKKKKVSLFVVLLFTIVQNLIVKLFIIPYKSDTMPTVGNSISYLFNYLYSAFIPYKEVENGYLIAGVISLFPVPLLLGLYSSYKYESNNKFIFPMVIVNAIETIVYLSPNATILELFERITLFSRVLNPQILIGAINYSNLLLIIYFISNYNEKLISFKGSIRFTIISMLFIVVLMQFNIPEAFNSRLYITFITIEYSLLVFTFLNYKDKRYMALFLASIIVFTMIRRTWSKSLDS